MPECKHLTTKCSCGAHPNSPDCRGREVDFCELREQQCDYSGSYEDTQDCWRWQERDAADWRALAEDLGSAGHHVARSLCSFARWTEVERCDKCCNNDCEMKDALAKLAAARKEEGSEVSI